MNSGRQLADINNNILQLIEEVYKFNIGMRIRINEVKEHMDRVGRYVNEHEKSERERSTQKEREEAQRQEESRKAEEQTPDKPIQE